MLNRAFLVVAGAAITGALAAAPAQHPAHGPAHWTYEGAEGPSHWADLDPSFKTCGLGHVQSPIDIPAASIAPEHLDPIRFDYTVAPLHLTDNGHTVMIEFPPGSAIHVGSAEYALQQMHFHRPSEEKIDGKAFAMVAHLVHKTKDGGLGVIAVLFEEGAENPALAGVFAHLPAGPGKKVEPAGVTFDPAALLPASRSYFTYAGSLTTPPCTEGVTWYVLRTPVTASAEQIAAFSRHYPHNARPVQPVGGRSIHASD